MIVDRGSTGHAAVGYGAARMMWVHHHGKLHDIGNALKQAGKMSKNAIFYVSRERFSALVNVMYGPWGSEAWRTVIVEEHSNMTKQCPVCIVPVRLDRERQHDKTISGVEQ